MKKDKYMLDKALELGQKGLAVFPVRPNDKRPLIKEWQKRATQDAEQIHKWWTSNPNANIGICCGLSDIVVVDLDVKNDQNGVENWKEICADLGVSPNGTRAVSTPSGGKHLYYKAPEGVDLGSGKGEQWQGIDIQTGPKCVVAPPSVTEQGEYKRVNDRPIAPLPDAIVEQLQKPSYTPPPPRPPSGRDLSAYVRAALDDENSKVAQSVVGNRNIQLNSSAFVLGQLVASDWANLDRVTVESELLQSAQVCGLPESEARATIQSGLEAGMRHPRPKPEPGDRQQAKPEGSADEQDSNTKVDLEEVYKKALDANASGRNTALRELAKVLSQHDPLTIEQYAERAKNDDLCKKGPLKQMVRELAEQDASDNHDGPPSDPALRDRWLERHNDTAYGLLDWRRYENGYWPPIEEETIRQEILQVIEDAEEEGIRPTSSRLNSVVELAKAFVYIKSDEWDSDPDILVCSNGTLHIPTRELRGHRCKDYATTTLPYAYNPQATCPHFEHALETTVPGAAEFIQEFVGYSLTTDTDLEIAIWLYGPPGSGKSTILLGIETMLGARAGNLGLVDIINSRFTLANIVGKTLLIATEQPGMSLRSTDVLNRIISGEKIAIEKKYQDPYYYPPYAKIMWAMNDLPEVKSKKSGLFRRVKIVKFPRLPAWKRDLSLKDKVAEEGPGILNWALDGLARLRERERFEIPPCVARATAAFRPVADISELFVEQRCEVGDGYEIQASILYSAYESWCLENGYPAQSAREMSGQWQRLGFVRDERRDGNYYLGLRMAENVEDVELVEG